MNIFSKIFRYIITKLRINKFYYISEIRPPKSIINQPLLVNGKGVVNLSKTIKIGNRYSPGFHSNYSYIEARKEGSLIKIGRNTQINNNLTIIANRGSIKIGENTLIGLNCEIINSDFHSYLYHGVRKEPSSKDIIVGNNVFIGNNVKILKGVKIGDNSVIGNSSLVTTSVEKNTVYAGLPARKIRDLKND